MNIGAFFDIDGTLYRDSLMIEHFKKLLKYEVFDPNIWHSHVKKAYDKWAVRRGNYDDYMLELAETYIESLKGMNLEQISFISDQVIKLKGDSVYSYTRDRINYHFKNNHKIFFISGSPDFLVEKMAQKYGATDFKATQYITDANKKFTGEVIQMWDSESKNSAIKKIVKDYDIDLSKSYAYGDTNGDFSMLKQVRYPIAINPTKELINKIKSDKELSKIAKIIVERKDVIYELDSNVIIK
jgi:HAD superfamily hydrolase (TIGR01490 family)